MSQQYLILDIGGSSIKYALMDENAQIFERSSVPTPLDTLEHLIGTIQQLYLKYQDCIRGIGISMPGIIDSSKGYCVTGGALTYIHHLPFVDLLKQYIPLPITIGNDAKCAGYAELGFGNLKDIDNGAVVVFGTGVGGCIIINRHVILGKHFSAGEFSYMKMSVLSGTDFNYMWSLRNGSYGLLKRVQEILSTNQSYTGYDIFEMANQGNEKIRQAIDDFTKEIAVGIFNIHTIIDCEKIAIGGGISSQPLFIDFIRKNFDYLYECLAMEFPKPEIVPCLYHNDANLVGAMYQHILNGG